MADEEKQAEKTKRPKIDIKNVQVWRDKDKPNDRKSSSGCRIL